MAKADRFEGLDADRITDDTKLARMSASFAEGKHTELEDFPAERAMLFKMQKMNDEIKELHRFIGSEITSNTATNLSVTARNTGLTINSSDGNNASLPAATATAWGVMTDDYLQDLATASIAPPAEGSYDMGNSSHLVWIPGTRFNGPAATYDEGVAKVTDRATLLHYDFAGIDRKKVTHVRAYTSATVSTGLTVKQWRGTHASSLATLANRQSTNSSIDITDWTCIIGESLSISIEHRSTSVALHGVLLTLAKA